MQSVLIPNFPELRHETVIPINEVPDRLPGGKCNPSTVQRWMRRGVNGVKLESFTIGGKRMTSLEALERFLVRVNGGDPEATSAAPVKPSTPKRDLEADRRKRFGDMKPGRNGQPAEKGE